VKILLNQLKYWGNFLYVGNMLDINIINIKVYGEVFNGSIGTRVIKNVHLSSLNNWVCTTFIVYFFGAHLSLLEFHIEHFTSTILQKDEIMPRCL
jgi:hypothetical protein